MKFDQDQISAKYHVDGITDGHLVINGQMYRQSLYLGQDTLVLYPDDGIVELDIIIDYFLVQIKASQPQCLVIGCDDDDMRLSIKHRFELESSGIGVELSHRIAAIGVYMAMLADLRKVHAIFIPKH